jgi:hypothetical protein
MMNKARAAVGVFALAAAAASVIACAGSAEDHGNDSSRRAEELTVCFYDGGPCIDADIPDPSTMFEAGAPGFPEGGGFGGGGGGGGGSAFGMCGFDPKYPTEYWTAVMGGTFKSCMMGCAAGECCYGGACVAE